MVRTQWKSHVLVTAFVVTSLLIIGCAPAPNLPGETGAIQFSLSTFGNRPFSTWAPFAQGSQSGINLAAPGSEPRLLALRSDSPEVATVDATATLRQQLFACALGTCSVDAAVSLSAHSVGQARIVVSENGQDLDAVTVEVKEAKSLAVRSFGRWQGNTFGPVPVDSGMVTHATLADVIEFAGIPYSASGEELAAAKPLTFHSTSPVLEGGGTSGSFEALQVGRTEVVAEFSGLKASTQVVVTASPPVTR